MCSPFFLPAGKFLLYSQSRGYFVGLVFCSPTAQLLKTVLGLTTLTLFYSLFPIRAAQMHTAFHYRILCSKRSFPLLKLISNLDFLKIRYCLPPPPSAWSRVVIFFFLIKKNAFKGNDSQTVASACQPAPAGLLAPPTDLVT